MNQQLIYLLGSVALVAIVIAVFKIAMNTAKRQGKAEAQRDSSRANKKVIEDMAQAQAGSYTSEELIERYEKLGKGEQP